MAQAKVQWGVILGAFMRRRQNHKETDVKRRKGRIKNRNKTRK
jgi:hypothetical protein